jgi:hypothetical protein
VVRDKQSAIDDTFCKTNAPQNCIAAGINSGRLIIRSCAQFAFQRIYRYKLSDSCSAVFIIESKVECIPKKQTIHFFAGRNLEGCRTSTRWRSLCCTKIAQHLLCPFRMHQTLHVRDEILDYCKFREIRFDQKWKAQTRKRLYVRHHQASCQTEVVQRRTSRWIGTILPRRTHVYWIFRADRLLEYQKIII